MKKTKKNIAPVTSSQKFIELFKYRIIFSDENIVTHCFTHCFLSQWWVVLRNVSQFLRLLIHFLGLYPEIELCLQFMRLFSMIFYNSWNVFMWFLQFYSCNNKRFLQYQEIKNIGFFFSSLVNNKNILLVSKSGNC